MYLYAGTLAGFLLWYFTLGRLFRLIETWLFRLLSTVLKAVFTPVLGLLRKLRPKAENILKKALFYPENLLKKSCEVVYNMLCLSRKKVGSDCGGTGGKEHRDLESAGKEKEEESSDPDRSYCLRHLPSVFPDRHAGEYHE